MRNSEVKIRRFEQHLREDEKANNTIEKYVRDIRAFYDWCDTKDSVDKTHKMAINKKVLLHYKDYLKSMYDKVLTVNSKISSLNSYILCEANNIRKIKYLRYQKPLFCERKIELTKSELDKLLSFCKKNKSLALIIETIISTGVRVSEIKYIT